MVQIVRKDCAAGLWGHLKDQFADLKATVMDTLCCRTNPFVWHFYFKKFLSLSKT
ncbi:hypothetical protein [Chryseobacterium sp. 5_R23647]|uniref:hypothetical protein n=1 Tax=Chryseobacterium sp. 5_R23647 TaxID=2258964 RepID=UPI001402DF0A|nr:hypothetical protein [Chryseobacterium sp. 5_R23647]